MTYQIRTSQIKGMGRNQYNLPYRSGSDAPLSDPRAPRSVDVTSPYVVGKIDIRWDNPAVYPENNCYSVLGVNVYRTFDSPLAAYELLTPIPVNGLWYRDQTQRVDIVGEDALSALDPGTNPRGEWIFKTAHKPLVTKDAVGEDNQNFITISPKDVVVEVDTGDGIWQVVRPFKVRGAEGEIILNSNKTYNPVDNVYSDPVLPDILNGGLRVSYCYVSTLVATNINRKVYYKVTTVAEMEDGTLIETPLDEVEAKSLYDMEKVDYIWAEAIRRNRWILEQGGERVKLFVRKWNGIKCGCYSEDFGYGKNTSSSKTACPLCYNTHYFGGYEGPYDVIIAPPESEKAVQLLDAGLHISYDWSTWTGPEPLLNDRDFIVRQNGDRFYITNVNYQGSRGSIYQQAFQLSQVDSGDPIYTVPISGGLDVTPEGWDAYRKTKAPSDASPVLAQKPNLPNAKPALVARTVTFENIMY